MGFIGDGESSAVNYHEIILLYLFLLAYVPSMEGCAFAGAGDCCSVWR